MFAPDPNDVTDPHFIVECPCVLCAKESIWEFWGQRFCDACFPTLPQQDAIFAAAPPECRPLEHVQAGVRWDTCPKCRAFFEAMTRLAAEHVARPRSKPQARSAS